ncbi:hypothetical protein BDB00DRAFT_858308, partial [Zychaea mexicana]|uniref:uncharacterized protein n=1 Tax=Zychaea mexicana TaxID=64656 RepID=UPI0022FEF025
RQKLAIVYKHKQSGWTQGRLAEWAKEKYALSTCHKQSTISDILKNADKFMAMTDDELDGKRSRPCAQPDLERALSRYVDEMESLS